MHNPIKLIYKFNKEAGLLEQGYNPVREAAFPIEEALEQFNTLDKLAKQLSSDSDLQSSSPKELSRLIVSLAHTLGPDQPTITTVDLLDKHLDILVYSYGSLFKLGLSPQDVNNALTIVAEANLTKLSVSPDSQGKQMKPHNFVGPEKKLQKLLDKIGIK